MSTELPDGPQKEFLDSMVAALDACVAGDQDRLSASLNAINTFGVQGVWAATCGWADIVARVAGRAGDGILTFGYSGDLEDAPPHELLAMRIVSSWGNKEHESALTLWGSAPQTVAEEASFFLLRLAAGVLEMEMREGP